MIIFTADNQMVKQSDIAQTLAHLDERGGKVSVCLARREVT